MNDQTPPAKAERLIVADDNEATLVSMKEMLSPYYEVDVAMSAIEVMRLYSSRPYRCLILDVTFHQGMSGLEIASRVRARDKEIDIIICSAVDYSEEVRRRVAEMNAQFIEKPVVLGELLEKLGRKP
jgi:DNA-binding NtrC family response regulator